MSQLESTTAKHQSALAETCRFATSSEFCNCARLVSEYVHLVSPEYGKLRTSESVLEKLEKLLVNPEEQLDELHHFTIFYLISPLKWPTTFSKQSIEYEIKKSRDEIVRAKNAFFGSAQKSANALRKLEFQENRLARFVELEIRVPIWRTVLESFVERCNNLQKIAGSLRSTNSRHQKKIEFEELHGLAYAKASALDAKTRQRASTKKNKLKITETCPYCDGPLGNDGHADHIYPVKRGGLSTIENMVYCCQTCNSLKGDKGLVEFLMMQGFDINAVYETLRSMGKRI